MHSTSRNALRRAQLLLSDDFTRASGRAFRAQLITFPISAVSGLICIRLMIGSLGPGGYGSVALITSLPALLPFVTLGLAAEVINSASGSRSEVVATFGRSFRILLRNCVLLCIVAVALGAAQIWHLLLSFPTNRTLECSATAGISLLALSLPLGLGFALALGAGRNHHAIYLQSIGPVANVLILCALHRATINPYWYVVTLMATPLPGAVLACRLGARALNLTVRDLVDGCRRRPVGKPARSVAGGMLVISVALPVTYQTDRIVISHMLGTDAVARYSAMAALYTAGLGFVNSAGQALWPQFARLRREGRFAFAELRRTTLCFVAVTLPMGAFLVLLAPWATGLMTHGQASAGFGFAAAFGLLLIVIGTHQPSGMFLTGPVGLRAQAWGCSLMALTSLVLSILLCPRLGISGPVLASAIAFLTCVWPATAIGLRDARTTESTLPEPTSEPGSASWTARASTIPAARVAGLESSARGATP